MPRALCNHEAAKCEWLDHSPERPPLIFVRSSFSLSVLPGRRLVVSLKFQSEYHSRY
jgi:hypothetical protein